MYRVVMDDETSLDEFRRHARALIANKIAPDDVMWSNAADAELFGEMVPQA